MRYIVPQKINTGTDRKKIKLFFRVDNEYTDIYITVSSGKTLIQKKKKKYAAPGEMESVVVKQDTVRDLKHDIKISVEMKG